MKNYPSRIPGEKLKALREQQQQQQQQKKAERPSNGSVRCPSIGLTASGWFGKENIQIFRRRGKLAQGHRAHGIDSSPVALKTNTFEQHQESPGSGNWEK